MHPQRERIAAVVGAGQGSGYLLDSRLVLTAAHVLGDTAPEVVLPGGPGPVPCEVVWSRYDDDCDAALLLAGSDLLADGERHPPEGHAPVWGRVEDLVPRPGAHAIGYPHVQRDHDGELEAEQLVGTLKPASGMLRNRQTLDSSHGAPAARPDGGSPWAGFSGAGVFLDDRLIGVVRSDPRQWRHGRVEITPAAAVLDSPGLLALCEDLGYRPRTVGLSPTADEFEQRLRDFIVKQSSTLHIIGLSRGGDDEEFWPLDASYFSLELLGPGSHRDPEGLGPVPQRAEQALSGHRRILVRGSAGSGKTTLLQWLATATARRELPPSLADFANCVPLLIRLRALTGRGELPSPEEFLGLVAKPLAGHPQAVAGWVTEQLQNGRILLLVDGVDEVPAADRARTGGWLTDLLDAYPDARYVVTTRPSAVREGWLAHSGFVELDLLPMSRGDVAVFLDKWHRAAGNDERLTEWRDALTAAMLSKPDLGRLATSPLMCALICALNRDRRGYLPQGRMELYTAALEMLLVRRDRERGIGGLELTLEQQIQLLQRLAWWLVNNGATEIGTDLAERKLADVLPSMPAITSGPAQVLDHLLVRSGLLRRPTAESLDFIHRTFQDYLAAKAAVEDEDLGVLVRNAHDDQWEDVLRMAVGHARPRERATLLRRLLAEAEQDSRMYLLAAACLQHATELDPAVRQEIQDAAARLVPPTDPDTARKLATAGPIVLDLLPGPDGLSDATAHAVVITATQIADHRAIPLLARYADHPSLEVREEIGRSWIRFDTRAYGEQVVSRMAEDGSARVYASSLEQLEFLAGSGPWRKLEWIGPLAGDELGALSFPLESLRLRGVTNPLGLTPLLRRCRPSELWLSDCPGAISLAPLRDSPVETLHLHWNPALGDMGSLADAAALRSFAIAADADAEDSGGGEAELRLPPGLTRLYLGNFGASPELVEHMLRCCRDLRLLYVTAHSLPSERRELLRGLRDLSSLRVNHERLAELGDQEPLPGITELHLQFPLGSTGLDQLPRVYPDLRSLRLADRASAIDTLDLSQLAGLHGCEVELHLHDEDASPSIFGFGKRFVPEARSLTIP
ncbi:NACHT domain-containing protein [Streptacidiphilus sp. EB129]|uniref:NACHT domain-containing protein n=1 Tax=Streptacidiphilus sp. EB129 TaxID=3156262 RepID=UPI0035152F0F